MTVRDEGRLDARIVLIGEAPGKHEMQQGRPFVGPSYLQKLAPWWRDVGLKREDFWITNVLDYLPVSIDRVGRGELEDAFARLHERLAALEDPWLIVPTGNYALYALTGKGKISWHARDGRHPRPGVTSHRGSIYEYIDQRGRRIKVIPTIHPAATFRTPGYERACRADWARIAGDVRFRELRLPQRTHRIRPSLADVTDFVADVLRSAKELALDIETPRRVSHETTFKETKVCECKHALGRHGVHGSEGLGCMVRRCGCEGYRPRVGKPRTTRTVQDAYLGCVGFAYREDESLTIPLGLDYWKNEDDARIAYEAVKSLCEAPVEKVLQNGLFDAYWLSTEGIHLRNFRWDTRAMHHALDPTDAHDLAYMASLYTRQPYWKDEAKDPDEIAKYASNSDALWTYNGIDVCVTLELKHRLLEELKRRDLVPFYNAHYADMLEPLLAISLHGVGVDEAKRVGKRDEFEARAAELQEQLAEQVGFPLHAKKGLSGERLKFYLYGPGAVREDFARKLLEKYPQATSLRLPKQYAKNAKKEKSVSTREVAVRRLALRFPDKLASVAEKILNHRRVKQLATFVRDGLSDMDGRIRCLYSPFTETGRLKSAENPRTTGRNIQNLDKELRDLFTPDKE